MKRQQHVKPLGVEQKACAGGFTLIELTIVMIVIGILSASLAPLLLRQHNNGIEEKDRQALDNARTAIINYAITYGGIPDPVSGVMPSLSALGVNNWGAFGDSNPFLMDVNATLLSSYTTSTSAGGASSVGGDKVIFCQAVNALMVGTASLPAVCQDLNNRTVAGLTAVCNNPVSAAFVLYSTGTDRKPNQGNALSNRIYENDKRGINNSPGDNYYDDQVMSYPASLFARDCREKMGVLPEVMTCPIMGQKYVTVMNGIPNNIASSVSYSIGADTWSVPANSLSTLKKCYWATDNLQVSGINGASAVGALDLNNNGEVDILIGLINATSAVTSQ